MEVVSNRVKENHTISADTLDDLASRFIINIPDSDRSNFVRICFQIELAHWFYLDFYCTGEENRALVPCGIKQFASHIFNHIPFLSLHVKNLDNILQEWKQYKMSVPTYGAILMTTDLKHVLLVQSYWAKSSWGFPKGKVNENEDPLHCAIREVYEETGYDIASLAKPDEFIEGVLNYQYTRLYLIRDVPIETVFVPRTRKEIKCCEWFSIEHLPTHKTDPVSRNHLGINANSFFMIMPFVKRLKKWINEQAQGNQMSKKSKGCDSKHTMAGVINSNAVATITPPMAATLNDRNDTKSPNMVFFKNNAGHRRQRHKSMGDFDSTNVVAHDSTGDTLHANQHHHHQQQQQNSTGNKINGFTDMNGVGKTIGGKRKLFAIDQTTTPSIRSISPFASNFQLQPVPINTNGNAINKQASQYILLKADHNRKKKNGKQRIGTEQNGEDMEHLSENECQSSSKGQQKWLFNPPKLSHLLGKEPNITNWSNVRLNKDVIMNESLKLTGKK
ncbi:mRNA decapping complex subunit 2 [Contarinia nasturtii]|uniref:mRNA decapping complex subunit 2 n=1 Tax=Contarinia nasturtii TaxID=265458 RepID=UPI0012D443BD|nr:mRNA decapping complex subunit 2 [Contarinia nasturtii]